MTKRGEAEERGGEGDERGRRGEESETRGKRERETRGKPQLITPFVKPPKHNAISIMRMVYMSKLTYIFQTFHKKYIFTIIYLIS